MALLLEREAAERLRISRWTVRALRLSGELPYLPGRPVRIDERDLDAYIEDLRRQAGAKARASPVPPTPTREELAELEAAARALAVKSLLRKRLKG